MLGNGDGTFQQAITYPIGSFESAMGMTVGDFNGDGKLDLAVSLNSDSSVAIFLGNGDGTLQKPVEYAVTASPLTIVTADINGDGKLDLVVEGATVGPEAAFSVLIGNGDGTFQKHVDYPLEQETASMTLVDLNGDGKLDVIVPRFAHRNLLTVNLGNGDGTFQSANYFATPVSTGVAAGDFNGDGMMDLVTANPQNNDTVSLQSAFVLSKTKVNFGDVKTGSSATVNVELTNIGDRLYRIRGISIGGQDKVDFSETNDCGGSLAAGAHCKIAATFTPSAPVRFTASLTLTDSAVKGSQTVLLQGKGMN